MRIVRTAGVVLLTTVLVLIGLQASGSAQPPSARSHSDGLTSAQRAYLDSKIAGLLASDPTARRLSINTVQVGGHALAIGAPGQRAVQAIGVPASVNAAGCPNLYLCGYHNGVTFQYTVCTTHYLSNWTGLGYIFNNQSTGTVTYLYKLNNAVYVKDVAKDQVNREVNWDPVWSIRVC
ncbi:MAG TPA: hypothetical protein VH298_09465 [Jatrophihabitans sp.]|jgi:hypothetical protein|nr:hypothetical protein [Jatrophihabitans sp.]